jgi:hypothetical protein
MESVLVYVKPICKNTDGTYEYDFFFSETPEYVWGQDWDVDNPAINGDLTPDQTTYNKVYRVKTTLPLKTIEETSCYSLEYATFGILALAWIDIENLDEYPENGRATMHFGLIFDDVLSIIEKNNWTIKEK